MLRPVIFVLSLLVFSTAAIAREAIQTFSLYSLKTQQTATLDYIAEHFEIVGREGDTFQIYVPIEQARIFETQVPSATLIAKDADADWRKSFQTHFKAANGYHDFGAIQDFMKFSAENYPDLVTLHNYGKTKAGRELNYLKFSSGQTRESNLKKPKIFLDAATHGDELISTEVLMSLSKELLASYGKDSRLTAMLDQTEIYFSYVVNPDGFVNTNRYEGWSDPNRSYPWPGDPNKKPTPSIQALIDLFEKERFQGAMTFHAFGKLLMYPWGYTYDAIENEEDRATFETLTNALSLTNDYTHGSIAKTIYVARGSSADYYYWKYGTKALAVELSSSKVPPASRIPSVVNEAREMVWSFIEHFYL